MFIGLKIFKGLLTPTFLQFPFFSTMTTLLRENAIPCPHRCAECRNVFDQGDCYFVVVHPDGKHEDWRCGKCFPSWARHHEMEQALFAHDKYATGTVTIEYRMYQDEACKACKQQRKEERARKRAPTTKSPIFKTTKTIN
jgi:hypothetical protein